MQMVFGKKILFFISQSLFPSFFFLPARQNLFQQKKKNFIISSFLIYPKEMNCYLQIWNEWSSSSFTVQISSDCTTSFIEQSWTILTDRQYHSDFDHWYYQSDKLINLSNNKAFSTAIKQIYSAKTKCKFI